MCLYPVKVTQYRNVLTGEEFWIYGSKPFRHSADVVDLQTVQVPCGKCIECFQMQAEHWAKRVVLEGTLHEKNCVVTLTYDPEHLPVGGTLCKRDVQLFLKRLREHIAPTKVRYFGCGEYGAHGMRPHYHLIIFGWCPDDLQFFQKDKSGHVRSYYISPTISKLWQKGYCLIDKSVDAYSGRYCAKYMQKLNELPSGVDPPFMLMSRRPGIGADAYKKEWMNTDKIYPPSVRPCTTPRYFVNRLKSSGEDVTNMLRFRCLKSQFLQTRTTGDFLRAKKLFFSRNFSRIRIDKKKSLC